MRTDRTNLVALKKRAALISLLTGLLMFTGKSGAYLITGSAAILSDAIESIIHIIATAFMFYSIILSFRPPTKKYPYGFGKIEYFSAGTEGFLIIFAAVSIVIYAINDIIKGPQIESLDTGMLIIGLAAMVNLILGFYLIRKGKLTNSIILVADGKHVLTDSYTSFGVVAGIGLVYITGYKALDPIAALLVALNILVTGKSLVQDSVNGLMNRSEEFYINKIAEKINSAKGQREDWIDIHLLRYWKAGERIYVDFHCAVPRNTQVNVIHEYEEEFLEMIKDVFNSDNVELKVHWDPCTPQFCFYCSKSSCPDRVSEKTADVKFDKEKIVNKAYYNFYNMPIVNGG